MPALHLEDIHLTRGRTPVFAGLNLVLREPRIGLIGHNGAGKTSLLRLLCGLETPERGRFHIVPDRPGAPSPASPDAAGPAAPAAALAPDAPPVHSAPTASTAPTPPPPAGRQTSPPATTRQLDGTRHRPPPVGMMFQNPDDQIIFPTVAEELALGLQPQGLKKREALQQARSFLAERGLEGWADRAISTLSQGQRQHVCWLSLLLAGPATLLLDEPYASLDLPGQARLFHDLAHTDRQLIVSTHLLDHVRPYPRVLWLDQGRIRADGDGASVCAAYEAHVRTLVAGLRATNGADVTTGAPPAGAAHHG